MNVETLLGDFGLARFVAEYLHRLPLALAGAAGGVKELGTWSVVGEILAGDSPDVMLVRGGERLDARRPGDEREARALSDAGYSIVVRHAERHHAGTAELARSFETAFCGPVDVQMFVTPPGRAGFTWHYDAEDVFILQAAGSKEYGLRKNTVNPWPLEETLPADMRYEREIMPLMTVNLAAGDLLYVPCGYWHRADASGSTEAAISLAVGVMSRTGVDVFDFLRRRVVDSLLWRQRLPIVGEASPVSAEEVEAAYRELFARLGEDLRKMLGDGQVLEECLAMQSSARETRE
jgi:ribosomal protein L16 Arg81 hydroxylase